MSHPSSTGAVALFGTPPSRLFSTPAASRQFSPLSPGSESLETLPPGGLEKIILMAPPGTLERRFTLALMLRALAPGGTFVTMAAKDMGGARLGRELASFGVEVRESAKAHHRICEGLRPAEVPQAALDAAIADGAPRRLDDLGLWSQPGIFSWDRLDPGTALLAEHLPALSGAGVDLGCGIGILAHRVLASQEVKRLTLVDIDRRAVEEARRNVDDPRVAFEWRDIRRGTTLERLDFVVLNPPFHDAGVEDRALGQAFLSEAARILRRGGRLFLVANRHLPYEATLDDLFRRVTPLADAHGFKVVEAVK